ncbi:(2Fe-2S)-binding protein [Homoserinimonas sp. A447]
MAARLLPFAADPIQPSEPTPVVITVDGSEVHGVAGQSIAGVLLAGGCLGFRRTSAHDRPRGVFCGIGVCFDCLVVVNGVEDVRACQRRAKDGDVVTTQQHPLPEHPLPGGDAG